MKYVCSMIVKLYYEGLLPGKTDYPRISHSRPIFPGLFQAL